MVTDSKNKTLTYKGGMYILLALLILTLVGGVITYRFSLLSHSLHSENTDEIIFYTIIGVAALASVIATTLAVRLNRNRRYGTRHNARYAPQPQPQKP